MTSFASAPGGSGALALQDEGDRRPRGNEVCPCRDGSLEGPEMPVAGGSVYPSDEEGWLAHIFFDCTRACGISVPQSGTKPGPTAVETWES